MKIESPKMEKRQRSFSLREMKENLSSMSLSEFMYQTDFLCKANMMLYYQAMEDCAQIVIHTKVDSRGRETRKEMVRLKDDDLAEIT